MLVSNQTRQISVNNEALTIRIKGSLLGNEYGVFIDIKKGEAKWDPDIPWHEPSTPDAPKDAKPCPGCKSTLSKLINGGIGWAKELMKVDQALPQVQYVRKTQCEECPSRCYDFGVCRDDWPDRKPAEQGCGCILALKITQKSEKCPHDHWIE